jgi:hypothetical protein
LFFDSELALEESEWTTRAGAKIKDRRGVATSKCMGQSGDDWVKNVEGAGEET